MELYSFKQKLTDKDLISYEYHLMRTSRSLDLNTLILGALAVGLGFYGIFGKENGSLVLNIILIALGLFTMFLFLPLVHLIIILKHKKHPVNMDEITVSFYENGILYKYTNDETQDERDVVIWENVKRIQEKKDFFYAYLYNGAKVLIFKKECIDDFDKFDELMDEYLIRGKRYLPKKRK